ncbi:MAG: hypothetical protein JOZ17_11565, partial [Acetobacteraceae bacterium]|nr:hypothetical protein [Acetobacteraceae bacterium]
MRSLTISQPTEDVPAPESISLAASWGALRRRKWLILAILLLVNAATLVAVLFISPRYTASALLVIEQDSARLPDGRVVAQPAPDPATNGNVAMATQANVLRSPTLAAQVITSLGIEKDPELQAHTSISARFRRWISDVPVPSYMANWMATPAAPPKVSDVQAAVPRFLERLSVAQLGESRDMVVSYTSKNPVEAARIANAVVHQYLNWQIRTKTEEIERASVSEREHLAELGRQLQDAEAKLTDYMAANQLALSGFVIRQPP